MINKLVIVIALLVGITTINAKEKDKESTVMFFIANMQGDNGKSRIEKALPLEKGVKDLIFDLERQKLTIVYQPQKTTPESLRKSLEKMGYQVKMVEKECQSAEKRECRSGERKECKSSQARENRSCCRSK